MSTYVLVQNPTGADARVDLTFNTGTDEISPAELQGVPIPAGTRQTYLVNNWVTDLNVSTMVEATEGQVVVERAMYGGGGAWATDSIGATSPQPFWYLAEGSTDGGMQTYVLVQNPTGVDATVSIVFNTGEARTPPPNCRECPYRPVPARPSWSTTG